MKIKKLFKDLISKFNKLKQKNKKIKTKKHFSFVALICLTLAVSTVNAEANSTQVVGAFQERACTFSSADSSREDAVTVGSRFYELLFGKKEKRQTKEQIFLCPGGDAFGVKICGSGVTVAKVVTDIGGDALKTDDIILSINKKEVTTVSEVRDMIRTSGGEPLSFEIMRDEKKISLVLTPMSIGSEYHLGVILADGASGIGTITYYDPVTLEFGGLGHGISGKDSPSPLKMTKGLVTGVLLAGAARGEPSHPGELRGVLTDKHLGELYSNTECGVFGKLTKDAIKDASAPIPIAERSEVKEGAATIISTVKSGKKSEYSIEISNIDYSSEGTKSFRIKVTDDTLLALTGGIVRGMGV